MGKLIKYQFNISIKTYNTLFVGLFIVLLPLIRFVDSCYEVGIVIDKWLAFGAMIMFADIYMIERQHDTIDVFYLSIRYKKASIVIRAAECFCTVFVFTFLMYIFCLFRVVNLPPIGVLIGLWAQNMAAFSATILFWGVLAFTLVNITNNLWTGLAVSILLWFVATSSLPIPNIINIFSYEDNYQLWYISKLIYIVIAVALIYLNLKLIDKSPYRG